VFKKDSEVRGAKPDSGLAASVTADVALLLRPRAKADRGWDKFLR